MIKTYQKSKNVTQEFRVIPVKTGIQAKITLSYLWQSIVKRKVMVFSLLFLLVTLPIFLLVTKYKSKVEAAWMDDAWSYRKAVAIPSHTTLETNVYVTVPTFDATDTSKFQADCGDLRFTKQNGEQLPYYVVDCDATANIHVQFDSLPAGASNYYMYYGNPSVQNGFSSADFSTAATGLGTQTLAAEEKSLGPVAYWKFDEGYGTSTNDSTQDNYDGTLGSTAGTDAGAPSWATEDQCLSGKCLYFDGTNDAVDFGDYDDLKALQFDTGNWSVSAWIRAPSGSSKRVVFGLRTGSDQDFHIGIDASNRAYVEWVSYPTKPAYTTTTSSSTIADNKWHQIGAKREGGTITLYVDGVSVGTDSTVASYDITAPAWFSRWTAGAWFAGCCTTFDAGVWQYFFKGFMDEIKIYPYARTAAQIKSDFASKGSGSVKGTAASLGSSAKNSDAFSNGLVGYWKMDEASWTNDCTATSVTDSSGNGNNGSSCPNGTGPTGGNLGKFGNGGTLNGTSQYLTSTLSTSLQPTRATLALWWKADSTGAYQYVIDTNSDSALYGYTIQVNPGLTGYYVTFGNVGQDKFTSYTFTAGTWYHISTTYDGSNIVTFINGSQQSSFAISSSPNITYSGGALNIGRSNNNSLFAKGTIDETRIYNRALSPKEVRDLYAWAPGPYVYLNFDEGSGNNIYDKSGNGYSGAWNGSGTHWTNGKFGKAGKFNGSTDYVNFASLPKPTNLPVTIEFWTQPNSSTPVGIFDSAPGAQYVFRNYSAGNAEWWSGSPSISLGLTASTWTHLAFIYDYTGGNQTITWYKNGVKQTTGSTVAAGTWAWTTFILGNINGGSAGWYSGNLDEFKIYNYARTSGQITEDMNAGHPLGGSPVGSQVGYWKFDEGYGITANNSGNIGSALNGTLTSSPSWSNSGKFGKALSFNGAGSYVDAGNDSSANLTNQLTITAWINPTVNDSIRTVVARHTGTNGYAFQLRNLVEAGRLTFYANGTTSTGNTVVPTGQWSYVAVTYDSSTTTVKFYLNGKLDGSNTSAGTILSQTQSLSIGRLRPADTIQAFNGLIDEVKIYNAALTEDEIKLDYNRGSAMVLGSTSTTSAGVPDNSSTGEYCVPGSSDSCSAPVGEWNFEEGSGVNVNDTSGNNYTGTWQGTLGSQWSNGKYGKAGKFNGSDNYVSATPAVAGMTQGTMETWVKFNSLGPGVQTPMGIGNAGAGKWRIDVYADGTAVADFWLDGNATSASGVIVAGQFYHLVLTFDGTTKRMYVNGRQVASAVSAVTAVNASTAQISGYTPGGYIVNGLIDQVRIFNYARTPAQIAYDYNRGAPVGHWKFDECQGITANDSSGNGNSGTITIGATGTNTSAGTCTGSAGEAWKDGAIGKYNSSLEFDGTDDYVNAGTSTAFDFSTTQNYTVSAWIYSQDWHTGDQSNPVVQKYEWGGHNGWMLGIRGGNCFGMNLFSRTLMPADQDRNACITATGGISLNAWHHVVGIVNRTTNYAYFYLDGVLAATSASLSGWTGANTAGLNLMVGHYGSAISGWPYAAFQGQIDDVKIFNYALTPQQIKTVYNSGAAVQFAPLTGTP